MSKRYQLFAALPLAWMALTPLHVSAVVVEADASSLIEDNFDGFINPTANLLYQQSVNSTVGADVGTVPGLNDGLASNFSLDNDTYWGNGAYGNSLALNPVVTFTLNLTGHPGGYTINEIQTINGWQNVDLSLSDQAYTVQYSQVGDPTSFATLTSVNYHPFLAGVSSGPNSSMVTLTGFNLTNVAALRFNIVPSTINTGVVNDTQVGDLVREFQAFNAPEPSTYAMMAVGLVGLLLVRRRMMA